MKEIKLSQSKVALVDDEDFEYLNQFKWAACKDGKTYYAWRCLKPEEKNLRGKHRAVMHREIMGNPLNLEIDHIDHDGLNNQKINLRICTRAENRRNSNPTSNAASKYKGVSWNSRKQRWKVDIMKNYKSYFVGYFKIENEAAASYNKAAIDLYGEYANLNIIV